MNISYRTRRGIRRFFVTMLILALAAIIAWVCWMIWVHRYIVYDRDGARLDFDSAPYTEGVLATPPTAGETIAIYYDEPDIEETTPVIEQKPIHGYYIDFEDLEKDISAVRARLETLPAGTAVLLDVKNIKGFFHYSTSVGTTTSKDVDIAQMDALFSYLANSELHAIARLPAFRDWEFGLNNVPSGLPKKGGNGSLWMDDSNCYWLDPTAEDTLNYLIRITTELRSLGFDEVVYTDFRFPDTDKIEFEGSQYDAIASAAATLSSACATDRFYVSFISESPDFALPEGNSRLYLSNIAAADVQNVAEQLKTDDPTLHLLFMTTLNDTRYDGYCVLRPLDNAH